MKVMYSRTGRAITHNRNRFQGSDTGDAYHIVNEETVKTLCGRDASDWFGNDLEMTPEEAADSAYCCQRCRKKFVAESGA